MGWHLRLQQRDSLLASSFTQVSQGQAGPLASLHRRATLEVGKSEIARAVSAIGCAQKRKQSRILAYGHELAVALSPALGGETCCKDPDFS
jgi:hypothetical protein